MKIDRISVYAVELPLTGHGYTWSGGNSVASYDTTVVRLDTDDGLTGWGEVCPLGASYLPAYTEGARHGLAKLAPHLLGLDPLQIGNVTHQMDRAMKGHPYVKSPLDIACWDLLGRAAGRPVCDLLGGRFGDDLDVYWSISNASPGAMLEEMARIRAEGITSWQLKVGSDAKADIDSITQAVHGFPDDLIVADANTGWLPHQARRVVNAVAELDVVVEQPCAEYEACRQIRHATALPFVLDESIGDVQTLLRALTDDALDVLNIKIGKVGGLTKAKTMRDLCAARGVAVTLDDLPGGDLTGATVLHLAQSTPTEQRFGVTASYLKTDAHYADGGPVVHQGTTRANTAPGLGVTPDPATLGRPLLELTA